MEDPLFSFFLFYLCQIFFGCRLERTRYFFIIKMRKKVFLLF